MKTTVVILAAGFGTRMRSKQVKVLHRAGGLPLVEHVTRASKAVAEPERTIVVTGHQADDVERALAGNGVSFVRQGPPQGTGHALAACRERAAGFDGLLMVLLGDAPLLTAQTLLQLRDTQAASNRAATLLTTTLPDPSGYGRVIVNPAGDVTAIVEHKVCTPQQREIRVINSGIYCFQAKLLWDHIAKIQPNPISNEYYLTDMFEILTGLGHRIGEMHIPDSNELLGINTRVELAQADRVLRDRKRRSLMLAGVTLEQPETITIDMDVEVGQDTVVEPFARLLGTTKIGDDCRVGAGAILDGAILGNNAAVHAYTLVSNSSIASGAEVGPFSRLRMNSAVEADGRIGNFVELKNTQFGAGSKSQHLAYLGDSTVGAGANIGAGTITCNYDGVAKHPTHIGAGAFVGSNSTLVAPVTIGDDSYIAAGSVITEEVPPEALALGRARQTLKHEWAKRRKQQHGKKH
ncbi:MAG: bifunctional UDP-N-acetylglucosamine diphosphorylase/glucosamine-1-phosphate N-acetyltransferase GlmU [Acidobacteriota bacterium]